jgi:hypothetical protein
MSIFGRWAEKRRAHKLAARQIHAELISWDFQVPEGFVIWDAAKAKKSYESSVKLMGGYDEGSVYHPSNSEALFSAEFDPFNRISGTIAKVLGFTDKQIEDTREDCKEKLSKSLSRIPQSRIERSPRPA